MDPLNLGSGVFILVSVVEIVAMVVYCWMYSSGQIISDECIV